MEKTDLKPTVDSYVACLACIGCHDKFDISITQRIIQDLENMASLHVTVSYKPGETRSSLSFALLVNFQSEQIALEFGYAKETGQCQKNLRIILSYL